MRCDAENIAEFLLEVEKQTNVKLSAPDDVKKEIIILFSNEKTARYVLNLVAEHCEWTWEKDSEGYRLFQSERAKREDEKLFKESLLYSFNRDKKLIVNIPVLQNQILLKLLIHHLLFLCFH